MNRTKTIIIAGVVGVGLVGGGLTAAAAAGDDNGAEPAISGTIDAPAEDETLTDAQEDEVLQQLATVTSDEARAAAIAAVPGTVGSIEIDDEDGFVVYDVDVTTDAGGVEVTVDAGTGEVLAQENDTDDDADDADEADDD
jgi:uncharacterized membrane protein YkoI